jgi:hypothetical protein
MLAAVQVQDLESSRRIAIVGELASEPVEQRPRETGAVAVRHAGTSVADFERFTREQAAAEAVNRSARSAIAPQAPGAAPVG